MHKEGQEGSFQKAGHWQLSAFKEKADLLWGVDGEKWGLSKAKEAQTRLCSHVAITDVQS